MKSLALAHAMMKKRKKMADGGFPSIINTQTPDSNAQNSKPLAMPIGPQKPPVKKAEGGNINYSGNPGNSAQNIKGVHGDMGGGMSKAGAHARSTQSNRTEKQQERGKGWSKDEHEKVLSEMKSMKKPNLYFNGGAVAPEYEEHSDHAAMIEDDKDLGQHGAREVGSYGQDEPFPGSESYMGGDIVDRIMAKRLNENGLPSHETEQKYSQGGRVANATPPIADSMPAEYDDLVLRDGLESHYGDDNNSGDESGDAQEDHDRADIVARIMASRKKKDRMPRPA